MRTLRTVEARATRAIQFVARLGNVIAGQQRIILRQQEQLIRLAAVHDRTLAVVAQQSATIDGLIARVEALERALLDQGEGWKLGTDPDDGEE